jgi:SET domain-containing protein
MYRPLPKELTIKESNIEGLGLFTTCDVDDNHIFGVTHIKDGKHSFSNGFIRTPLGGFINHSKDSNAKLITDGDFLKLKTKKSIKAGEEITLTYTIMGYDIEELK